MKRRVQMHGIVGELFCLRDDIKDRFDVLECIERTLQADPGGGAGADFRSTLTIIKDVHTSGAAAELQAELQAEMRRYQDGARRRARYTIDLKQRLHDDPTGKSVSVEQVALEISKALNSSSAPRSSSSAAVAVWPLPAASAAAR